MSQPKQPAHTDPGGSRERDSWEPLIQRITAAAGPELALRRQRETLTFLYSEWCRPVMAAAAVLTLVFGSILAFAGEGGTSQDLETPLLADALTPTPLSLWMSSTTQPTLVEAIQVLEGGWE